MKSCFQPNPMMCVELDEVRSFVQKKANKSWLRIGLCRRTLEVVAYAVGGRGAEVCEQLKAGIPQMYGDAQTVRLSAGTIRCAGDLGGL